MLFFKKYDLIFVSLLVFSLLYVKVLLGLCEHLVDEKRLHSILFLLTSKKKEVILNLAVYIFFMHVDQLLCQIVERFLKLCLFERIQFCGGLTVAKSAYN